MRARRVTILRRIGLFLLLLVAVSLRAQTGSIPAWPEGSPELNRGWRVHLGDDPAYAKPGFDDSQWRPIALHPASTPNEPAAQGRTRWYRLHVHLPTDNKDEALLITRSIGSFELYITAQAFGQPKPQNDDITVLTLNFAGVTHA
jgi:hypothetical protein